MIQSAKRIGVIGLGSIGLRHARNLIGLGHEVVGYDPDKDRRALLKTAGGLPINSVDLVGCDGIIIASPTKEHGQQIEKFSDTNCRLFVEKPIADWIGDYTHNVDMVGYNLRFHSGVTAAKKMLDAGEIGKPYWAEFIVAQSCLRAEYLRDGVILNWSHEIDLALHMLGPAKVLTSATRLTNGQDDIADIILEHGSGCRSFIHLDYVANPEKREFTIFGDGGSLRGHLTLPRSVTMHRRDRVHPHIKYTPGTFDLDYIDEMRGFIDCIDGKTHRGATAEDGLRVLEICLEVRKQAGLA